MVYIYYPKAGLNEPARTLAVKAMQEMVFTRSVRGVGQLNTTCAKYTKDSHDD